jgi:hypothetical protein
MLRLSKSEWRTPGLGSAFLLSVLLVACREGPAEYTQPIAPPVADSSGRLTFNLRDDRSPHWNRTSDSVLYASEGFIPFPATKGLLLAVARAGGTAVPLVPAVQLGVPTQPWLTAPALSSDGSRIAFFEITDTIPRDCDEIVCEGAGLDTVAINPVLERVVLRVRQTASSAATDQAVLPIPFEGFSVDSTQHPFELLFVNREVVYPFQRHFLTHRSPMFRASWSPDGTRLAFSDGVRIRIWTVGQPGSLVVPNTEDGVFPSWSPDGNWIAFTKLERGEGRNLICNCLVFVGANVFVAAQYQRVVYGGSLDRAGTAMVVRPDGSGAKALGEGFAPSWLPDSREIVVTRRDELWRLNVDAGTSSLIPNTLFAYEPAVSPDGKWVAFAREAEITHDIWVVPLR